jgi:hypothetical protein
MPYKVSYDKQDKIVIVRVFGKAIHDEHRFARKEAFQLCKENNCSGILVDLLDLDTEKSTTLGCYESGESLAQGVVSPTTRIANVLPKDPKSAADVKFTVTVAANRGRITDVFDSIDEAKRWLIEGSVRPS